LRVTAQLINVDDGFHLWSENYDRRMADIFDIQDEVAGEIMGALQLHLAPSSERLTDSAEAYTLYLEALAQLDDSEIYQDIIDLLDRAIRIDPQFAKAHELKAAAYWGASGVFLESSRAQLLIHEAASHAIELDPSLVFARSLTKTADPDTWNWQNEFKAIEEAIAAEPDNVQLLVVWTYDLLMCGYFEEGLQAAKRLKELDPLSPQAYWPISDAYIALDRLTEARAVNAELHDEGFEGYAAQRQAYMYFMEGRYDEGVDALGDWFIDGMNGQALREFIDNATDPQSGLTFLRSWVDEIDASSASYYEKVYARLWYLALGYLDDYWREIIEVTPESPHSWTNAEQLEYIGVIWHTAGFRRHSNYIPYAAKYGMLDLWDARGAPDFCSKTDGQWACE
jgi:tetratricopeptide (TPR) repeat protein